MKFRKSLWMASILVLPAILLSSCNLGATPIPTQDVGAIQTDAFNMVLTQSAQQQTQLAPPPTPVPSNTPFPTAGTGGFPTFAPVGGGSTPIAGSTPFITPLAGFTPLVLPSPTPVGGVATVTTKNGCNDATYVGETWPYDGTVLKPGQDFSKGWSFVNTGTCAWDEGYSFKIDARYGVGLELFDGSMKQIVLKKETPAEYTIPGAGQTYILNLRAPVKEGEYKWYFKMQDDGGNKFGPLVSVIFTVAK